MKKTVSVFEAGQPREIGPERALQLGVRFFKLEGSTRDAVPTAQLNYRTLGPFGSVPKYVNLLRKHGWLETTYFTDTPIHFSNGQEYNVRFTEKQLRELPVLNDPEQPA